MDSVVQTFAVANLRRRPVVVETGGFVAGFDPATDNPGVNYATPLPGSVPTAADVAALVAAFREHGRLPRLEFAPAAVPGAEAVLRAAGFAVEAEHEYLVCSAAPVAPAAAPETAVPSSGAEFAAVDAALNESFGFAAEPTAAGIARLRRLLSGGGSVRYVPDGAGGCAGAASCSAPAAGTAELAGVGTRPAFRGRGIAGAVTAALTRDLLGGGARSVWLEYGGEGSRRVYERVGFRPAGRRLYLALPEAGGAAAG